MARTEAPQAGLARTFQGELIRPDDPGYGDARRVWNGTIDKRPALIARCTGAADVAAALRFARERELPLAVRGGGHSVAGTAVCDDGVVIDLSPMRGVKVYPEPRVAHVQAGVLLGELDTATQAFGLATPAGIVSHTGVAGLTLGGGIGWLSRKLGATVDNLRSARVVTADGEHVNASERENPDLFWGLRGGGGNFGIVTEFEFHLHPVGPTVLAGPVYYALEDGVEVLRRYREVAAAAPDELTTILNLRKAPALPLLPAELHGRPVVTVVACWAGELERGQRAVQPLRELGTPLVDLLRPRPFVELQRLFNAAVPHGWHYYWKSIESPPFEDAMIDTLIDHTARITSPRSYTIIFQLGGALARVAEGATAYPQRDAAFNVNINAVWLEGDPRADEHNDWTRDFYAAVEPHAGGRVYVNFLGDEGEERVRAAYGEEKYERLRALKRRYDPTNVFRLNQNIRPD
jgi:FAD/FMN-containing dehydrogenase